jgi:hypothetical protein
VTIPNRLLKTDEQYAIRAKQLCSQAARAYGYESPHSVPLTTVVEYVIRRKPTYARNTWKQYKNALRYHAQTVIDLQNEKVAAEEAQAAIRMLDRETSEGCMKAGTRTSARKQKTFKKADFDKVIAYLQKHVGKHRYARTLATWLKASRLTGLRPSEWEHADLTQIYSTPALVIRNAKATNGRANGEERTLLLDLLMKEQLETVQDMIEMLEGYSTEIPFAQLQKLLGDYMNRATRKCFGKRKKYPTLYSNRHQFSADAKMSGHSKAEVAALLGQASDETAGIHYARKASGESPIKVSPLPSEVKTVRIRSRTFQPRHRKGGDTSE